MPETWNHADICTHPLFHFTCGTCGTIFDWLDLFQAHRLDRHPEKLAAQAAYEAVIADGGTEDEAETAYDAVKADHLRNAQGVA